MPPKLAPLLSKGKLLDRSQLNAHVTIHEIAAASQIAEPPREDSSP
jgi:hypothetical protein